jgi:hypothetical protein
MIANKRRWIVLSLAVGLLGLGLGPAYVAADDTIAPEDTFVTHDAGVGLFSSTVVTEPRSVIQFTGNLGTIIPGTRVEFTQHSKTPQAVLVTFVADWRKPRPEEIPEGGYASGVTIQVSIDDREFQDPISTRLGGATLFHNTDVETPTSVVIGAYGFTFVTEPIPPGDHVLQILASSSFLGQPGQPNGTVVVRGRSTVVQHK